METYCEKTKNQNDIISSEGNDDHDKDEDKGNVGGDLNDKGDGGRTGGTIVVHNLPRQWNQRRFERFLRKTTTPNQVKNGKNKPCTENIKRENSDNGNDNNNGNDNCLEIVFVSCQKNPRSEKGTIVFAFESEREEAMRKLRSVQLYPSASKSRKQLRVEMSKAHVRSELKHATTTKSKDVRDSVAPLWRVDYCRKSENCRENDNQRYKTDESKPSGSEAMREASCEDDWHTLTTQLDLKQNMVISAMRRVTVECRRRFEEVFRAANMKNSDKLNNRFIKKQRKRKGVSNEIRCTSNESPAKKARIESEAVISDKSCSATFEHQGDEVDKRISNAGDNDKIKKDNIDDLPPWIRQSIQSTHNLPGEYIGIVRSPVIDHYRNKVEFSVGPGVEDSSKATVGFNVGLFKDGFAGVAEPSQCPNISLLSIALAKTMQSYIRNESKLPAWDKRVNAGFWRLLLIRESGMISSRKNTIKTNQEMHQKVGNGCHVYKQEWQRLLFPPKAIKNGAKQDTGNGMGIQFCKEHLGNNEYDNYSSERQIMVVVQISPKHCMDDIEIMRKECFDLADRLSSTALSFGCGSVMTLLAQLHDGCSNRAPDDAQLVPLKSLQDAFKSHELHSESKFEPGIHIHETLLGLKFRVSPTSFFQVNTAAAENLYSIAGEWALGAENHPSETPLALQRKSEDTLLFDVCSGTGTIGLTIAHRVGAVVGIELCKQAVEDSRANAKLNNIDNVKFICGKAEDVLKRELHSNRVKLASNKDRGYGNIVAIVDPPRCGLHKMVLKSIKKAPELQRLVYISCNPVSCANDIISLCSPPQVQNSKSPDQDDEKKNQKSKGAVPFVPIKFAAVDLFPHANHCETIVLLERRTRTP